MSGFTHTEMKDLEFSAWLRKKGWTGQTVGFNKHGVACTKFCLGEEVLALVFYDNSRSTRRIYLKNGI